jgi:quercetin dioxygenase-like cupin family protein
MAKMIQHLTIRQYLMKGDDMQATAPQAIEQLRTLWVIGHKVTPIPAGDRVAALLVATPVGTPGPPPHYHADSAESFYVVAGRLGVMAGDEWTSLGPGGYVEVPRGVVHTFRNEGEEEARTITIFEVPGFENWFEEFGYDTTEPGAYEKSVSQNTIQRVLQGSARHQMIITPEGPDAEA